MLSLVASLCFAGTVMSQLTQPHHVTRPRQERLAVVEPVKDEDLSLIARIVGEETQGKVVDSILNWARDKAKENPGCVER